MAIQQGQMTVTTTPTALPVADTDRRAGMSVLLVVPAAASQSVYWGGPTVSAAGASQGVPLAAGAREAMDLNTPNPGYSDSADTLYLVVASGTQVINWAATGV